MALITLVQAKDHLGETTDNRDNDIYLKTEQASQMIVDRCNTTAHWRAITSTWNESTVPAGVQAAIFLVLTHLVENKGDNMTADPLLWAAVERLISLHKDPVIA